MVEFERLKREGLVLPIDLFPRTEEDLEELRDETLEPDCLEEETPLLTEPERLVLVEVLLTLEEPMRDLEPTVLSEA